MTSQPLSLYFCYTQQDAAWQERFETHLIAMTRNGWIHCWSDRNIRAGEARQSRIDHYLRTAHLILLLVSADSLGSEEWYSEMLAALKRHQADEACVIPILLGSVAWKNTPLGELQALPRDGRPVTNWDNHDEAFLHIATEIQKVIEALRRPVVLVSCLSDQTFTEHLASALTTDGISICTPEPLHLQEPIREAAAVVVIASSQTEHTRTLKEVQRLANTYQCPLLGVWISNAEQDDGPPPFQSSQRQEWISVYLGQEEIAFQQIRTALHRELSHHAITPPREHVMNQEPRNPYKGLRAFTAHDANDFFGRTSLIEALVASLKTNLSSEKEGRLLAVVGASGSGKSSVVDAGLLPALKSGKVFDSEKWIYLDPIKPGAHPLDALTDALTPTLFKHFPARSLDTLNKDLRNGSERGLHSYAAALAKQQGCTHIVLVVDQFEEIFTLSTDEQERQQFLDLVVAACTQKDGPLIVILTLRADFYGHLIEYWDLYELAHLTPMRPMILSDLRAVITEPANLPDVQLTFEGNLVGDMLFDIQGQIGALPLLQFTLEQLFLQREEHLLTEQAYQDMGGVKGALTKHADETYRTLPSEKHRQLARTVFLRLLDPGMTEQETTRRRAALTEFQFVDPGQTHLMQETLNAFVNARLLTTTANERIGVTMIEVSHEALIREWPTLVNWLGEARNDIPLQQNISKDAATWEQNNHAGDHLYLGRRLKEAQAWAKRNTASKQEQMFLRASVARQTHNLLAIIIAFLLVVTSSGVTGWIILHQPKPDYVTTTNDDDNDIGSLRWALNNAHSNSTIKFDPSLIGQTITLKPFDIHITQPNLIIQGPSTGHIMVRVSGKSVIVDTFASVIIANITFQGSNIKDQRSLIQNRGKLTLKTCIISSNTVSGAGSDSGGAIFNDGTLIMSNSIISGNKDYYGSGIYNSDSGNIIMSNSIVLDNISYSFGGSGIYNDSGKFTMINSIVSDNISYSGKGGGIYSNDGTIIIINSIVSDNISYSGGGIYSDSGTLIMINSTVSDNTSSSSEGGGIYNDNPDLISRITHTTLIFCTIVNNQATNNHGSDGSDIAVGKNVILQMKASIVGGNNTSGRPIAGVITSDGYNIIQNMSPMNFTKSAAHNPDRSVDDLTHVLGPSPKLSKNGGSTETYQLISNGNNPAINLIPQKACTDATGHRVLTDQREMPRPGKKKPFCDSGAYEDQDS